MAEYLFANRDGEIITEDYDGSTRLSANQVKEIITYAFMLLPYAVEVKQVSNMNDVFHVTYPNGDGLGDIFICAKGTTPGGRSGLRDEQRIQIKSKYLNYVYDRQVEGKKAVFLGAYSRDGQIVLCKWRVAHSDAASGETTISKQIKITSIANAIREGFVRQSKGNGEYACAFRPELLYFYLRNSDWLHNGGVSEPAEHTPPEADITETDTTVDPKEQKERFRAWMSSQINKKSGNFYSKNTIGSYIGQMEHGYSTYDPFRGYTSAFQIQDIRSLAEYTDYLFHAPGFDEFNRRAGNNACSCGFNKYREFLAEQNNFSAEPCFNTSIESDMPRNRIIFGAPGTGKSYTVNCERKELLGENNETDYERVTFHPDYSYANFVGTYKPVPYKNSEGKDAITYEYVPGPFMRVYVNALKSGRTDNVKPYLLIVEEINRANVAAVFGDVFQLLDRDENEVSEYPIQAPEDIKQYLSKELGGNPDDYSKIYIPNNMFIWATMNSADQGVLPMDTAFKRRWDFTYLGIDSSESNIQQYNFDLPNGKNVNWNTLRTAINKRLSSLKINEDKLMGPFFLSQKVLDAGSDAFVRAFKNKVLMYLFEDAGKQRRSDIFRNNQRSDGDVLLYSVICDNFDQNGIEIFCDEISNAVPYNPEEISEAENE